MVEGLTRSGPPNFDQATKTKTGKSSKKSRRAQIQAFKLLYSLVVFQIYDGFEDGLSVLSEIDHCFEKYFAEKNGATPDASSEVLVEVLLSLVSRTSALLRKLSHQVFTAFAREISKEGLQLLLDVLEAKESLAGQQSLFDQEENDDEDDSDESMAGGDQDADSDVEIISAEGTDDDDDQDTSEEGGAEQAGSPEDNDELARLNTALAQIVGTQPFDGDGPGDESDSLSAMSDTAMFALDDQMSRVFKERQKTSQTSKAQEKKTAKTTVLNLKNRVLDLLDIYVKTQHRSPRALRIILPLLRLIRTTGSKQIADRACGILRDFSQKCRGKDVTVLKPKKTKHAWEVLEQVHQEAMHDASRAHAAACSHGSLLVVKGLVAADNANVKRVVARYAATQTEWLQGFGKVQPGLFSDFLNWGVSCARQQQQQQQQQQQH
ncbi:MAG: DNA-directed DNA polymerase [Thelocarpon impressellum]|nr:MAG: DNA-directed DNA polymerase [Thelocarpon impressellum]